MENDKKIKQIFGEIHSPSFDILKGVKIKMEQKSKYRPMAFRTIIFACAILILSTGAVLAAYQGGFARLRGIVGDEHAADLTPIEVGEVLDVPYLSGGFRNPNEDRFAIELVAVYGEVGGLMDFYFTLEDLTDTHNTSDFVSLSFVIQTFDYDRPYVFGGGVDVIDDTDGIITVRAHTTSINYRRQFGGWGIHDEWSGTFKNGYVPEFALKDGALNLTVMQVFYNANIGYVDHRLDIDLSLIEVLTDDDIRVITNDDLDENFPEWWTFVSLNQELLATTGVAIPNVGLHNLEVNIAGVGMQISSIGIIDGVLNILMYEPLPHYSNFAALFLVCPRGNRYLTGSSMLFSLRPDGTLYERYFYRDTAIEIMGGGRFSSNPYQLLVFSGFDQDNIGEFSIEGIFDTGSRIWLEWNTKVVLD